MADYFENLFVEVNPKLPYSKNSRSANEDLLDVKFWFRFNMLMRRKSY